MLFIQLINKIIYPISKIDFEARVCIKNILKSKIVIKYKKEEKWRKYTERNKLNILIHVNIWIDKTRGIKSFLSLKTNLN